MEVANQQKINNFLESLVIQLSRYDREQIPLSEIPKKYYHISKTSNGVNTYCLRMHNSWDDLQKICPKCITNPTEQHNCESIHLWSFCDLNEKTGREIADMSHVAMCLLSSMGMSQYMNTPYWSDGYVLQLNGYVLMPIHERIIILYNHIKKIHLMGLDNYNIIFTISN